MSLSRISEVRGVDGSALYPPVSGDPIDWSAPVHVRGNLPGKALRTYSLPSDAHIEGALATLILYRGGAPERVCATHVGTVEHAYLHALAQLGDEDAMAFLSSKGFVVPHPLRPARVTDFAELAAPIQIPPAGPTHMVEIGMERAGDCAALTITIDPRPLSEALWSAVAALRALSARMRERVAEIRGRRADWSGGFTNPDLHRND